MQTTNTYRLGRIELSKEHFEVGTLDKVKENCEFFGPGWRLPKVLEYSYFQQLHLPLGVGGFKCSHFEESPLWYWTSDTQIIRLGWGENKETEYPHQIVWIFRPHELEPALNQIDYCPIEENNRFRYLLVRDLP